MVDTLILVYLIYQPAVDLLCGPIWVFPLLIHAQSGFTWRRSANLPTAKEVGASLTGVNFGVEQGRHQDNFFGSKPLLSDQHMHKHFSGEQRFVLSYDWTTFGLTPGLQDDFNPNTPRRNHFYDSDVETPHHQFGLHQHY